MRCFQRTCEKRTELGTPRVRAEYRATPSTIQRDFIAPHVEKRSPPTNGGDGGPFTAGGKANRKSQASSLARERNGAGSASQAAPHALLSPWPVTSIAAPISAEVGKRRSPSRQPWSRFRLRHRSSARPPLTSAKPPQVRPKRTPLGPETSRWPPDGSSERPAIALCPLAAA